MADEIKRWNEVGPRYGLTVVGPPLPDGRPAAEPATRLSAGEPVLGHRAAQQVAVDGLVDAPAAPHVRGVPVALGT